MTLRPRRTWLTITDASPGRMKNACTREARQARDRRGGGSGFRASRMRQSGGSPAADGPLSSGDGPHDPIPRSAVCTPYGGPQTNGLQVFKNFGNTTVILTGSCCCVRATSDCSAPTPCHQATFWWETRTAGRPGSHRCLRGGNTGSRFTVSGWRPDGSSTWCSAWRRSLRACRSRRGCLSTTTTLPAAT